MTKKRAKMSFSKLAVALVFVVSLLVIIYACGLMWYLKDATGLAYLIPSVEVCLTTVLAFYLKKAEKENTKGGITYDSAMQPPSVEGEGDQNED